MKLKLTNTGHRRGFIHSRTLEPGESITVEEDIQVDELDRLKQVSWLGVERIDDESKEQPKKDKDKGKIIIKPRGEE